MEVRATIKREVPEYALLLKSARTSKKMTLEDVAKKTGHSTMLISFWEKGQRTPKITDFENWLAVFDLGIKVDFLKNLSPSKSQNKR
jgi:transcriptional regulator with XRE-family HTH domain